MKTLLVLAGLAVGAYVLFGGGGGSSPPTARPSRSIPSPTPTLVGSDFPELTAQQIANLNCTTTIGEDGRAVQPVGCVIKTPGPTAARTNCDPAYPEPRTCIPPGPPLEWPCAITSERNFVVLPADPRGLDHDDDGVGCEPIGGLPQTNPEVPIAATLQRSCDPAYPSVCIPPSPPNLSCDEVAYEFGYADFAVLDPDPHGFDGDYDGFGCEPYAGSDGRDDPAEPVWEPPDYPYDDIEEPDRYEEEYPDYDSYEDVGACNRFYCE